MKYKFQKAQKIILYLLIALALTHSVKSQDSSAKTSAFHDLFLSGYVNFLNDGSTYGMGISGGYYKNIYAEARYNYEDLQTFSLFAGYAFSNDEHQVKWEIIPMVGIAVGQTNAILPAMEASAGYKKINFNSQLEYAVSLESKKSNYWYAWSELTYALASWLEPGIVIQRSKLYKTGRQIDRGLMLNSNCLPHTTASVYLFDPFDRHRRFLVVGINYAF